MLRSGPWLLRARGHDENASAERMLKIVMNFISASMCTGTRRSVGPREIAITVGFMDAEPSMAKDGCSSPDAKDGQSRRRRWIDAPACTTGLESNRNADGIISAIVDCSGSDNTRRRGDD